MNFAEAKLGRVFVLRLHDSDHLPDVLETFAAEHNMKGAICFFVGGAKDNSRIVVGPKNDYVIPPEPMITLLEGVHEVCGLGTIFADEKGRPKLHMHASFGRKEETITGCVRMGVDVWRIGEIIVLELTDTDCFRAIDKVTRFEFLEVGKKTES